MAIRALLGFAPFIAFAVVEKLVGIVPGLIAGLVVSIVLAAWEAIRHHSINILESGSAIIFGTLVILALRQTVTWSTWDVRLYVDAGLSLVVFLSVILSRPFTMQAGQKQVSADVARSPAFLRHNVILSCAWGAAFAALAAIDLHMTLDPQAPDRRGVLLTLAVLAAAAKFTQVYVKRIRSAAQEAQNAASR
jgi:hypothetical protein